MTRIYLRVTRLPEKVKNAIFIVDPYIYRTKVIGSNLRTDGAKMFWESEGKTYVMEGVVGESKIYPLIVFDKIVKIDEHVYEGTVKFAMISLFISDLFVQLLEFRHSQKAMKIVKHIASWKNISSILEKTAMLHGILKVNHKKRIFATKLVAETYSFDWDARAYNTPAYWNNDLGQFVFTVAGQANYFNLYLNDKEDIFIGGRKKYSNIIPLKLVEKFVALREKITSADPLPAIIIYNILRQYFQEHE